jgi:glycosyltransferase involved in cell wall biosynthesis
MHNTLPNISIVTVSYNQGKYIEENILSVLNQNYPNVEHIIIDAGSTDETLNILKRYDKHLDWISEPDNGQSHGLNKGFKKASGEIIGWFNSDDRVAPYALHKIANIFVNNPNEIAVIGDQRIINENGEEIKCIKSRSYTYDYLLNHARGITQNSIFFKKSVFNQVGYLNESLNYAMDRDFFIRLSKLRDIPYMNEILGEFRIQADAKTSLGSYYFAKELIRIRKTHGGRVFSPGNINDWLIITTEPLRRVKLLRKIIQKYKGVYNGD